MVICIVLHSTNGELDCCTFYKESVEFCTNRLCTRLTMKYIVKRVLKGLSTGLNPTPYTMINDSRMSASNLQTVINATCKLKLSNLPSWDLFAQK